jgi:hypothetical protein
MNDDVIGLRVAGFPPDPSMRTLLPSDRTPADRQFPFDAQFSNKKTQTLKLLLLLPLPQIFIMVDLGLVAHSPSAELMTLVDVDHMSDFDQVVTFLAGNLDKVISEVHGFDKLMIDNGKTQLNCPPAPEAGDSHGAELVRTLSEKQGPDGILTLRREFKVHDMGADPDAPGKHKVEIRENIVGGPNGFAENIRVVSITRE